MKGPNATTYTQFSASATDIYYPTTSDGFMFSAYKEVTDYVRANGIGEYTAADLAVNEGNGGGTGFYGGWSLIVVYENSKMKYRDVTIFDGHAYVTGGTASFEIPVAGFNTVQAGPVGVFTGKTNPLTIQYDALQIANMEIAASGNKGVKINQSGW